MQFFLKDDLIAEFLKLTDISVDRAVLPTAVSVIPINERLLKYIESLKPYFAETEKIENGLIKIKHL